MTSDWKAGIMGVIVGDALGCPVQFWSREEIAGNPVTGMRGFGTYNMPPGTWTDDSSMTLATIASIREKQFINLPDIMYRFACWLTKGEYTPFGESFDVGRGTMNAIVAYIRDPDVHTCGGRSERNNGNGSLMRIMPVCLYCCEKELSDEKAISLIHSVSALTHAHLRAQIACGLYYFMVSSLLQNKTNEKPLIRQLQDGLDRGFRFYKQEITNLTELSYYGCLADLYSFQHLHRSKIDSSGYVVDTLEAVIWSLLHSSSFEQALLTAVNLGDDTDTVGAICGGLAGLYYGYDNIPEIWLDILAKRNEVENMCVNVLH